MMYLRPLEAVCDLLTDGTHYTPRDVGQGVPFLTVKDVSDSYLDFRGCSHISETDFRIADAGNSAPKAGDILFSKDGTVGKVHVVRTSQPFAVLSSLAILRPTRNAVDSGYLAHVLRSPAVIDQAMRRKTGSAIRRIILSDLGQVRIPVPPLQEQRRIAAILDQADALRAKRRAAIAKLDSLTQSIFVDMFGDLILNDKGWPIIRLAELLTQPLRNGVSPSNQGQLRAKVLTLSAITGAAFKPGEWKDSTFLTFPDRNQRVCADDFLICRGNGNLNLVGKGYFPKADMPDTVFPDTVIAARVDGAQLLPRFLETQWKTSLVRSQIEALARTTNGTQKINQSVLEGLRLVRPPRRVQEDFVLRMAVIERVMARSESNAAHLDSFFSSLQHRAFRGEL